MYIISSVRSTEVYSYNLGGAQSHAKVSFEMADWEYTSDVDTLGTLRLFHAIRTCGFELLPGAMSEPYGKVVEMPQPAGEYTVRPGLAL